jgi:hypothetical protein
LRPVLHLLGALAASASLLKCFGPAFVVLPNVQALLTPTAPGISPWIHTLSHRRSPLAHDESEAPGYGAYGYILFPEAPSDPRSQVILQGYQTYISRGDDPQRDPSMANITYLLVDHEPPSGVPDVAWLVAHYDVERAKTLLRSQHLAGRGPFLVTSTSPLTAASEPAPRSAVIDLENLAAGTTRLWVDRYLWVCDRPETWLNSGADLITLQVDQALLAVDAGADNVIKALADGRKILEVADAE